MIGMKLITERCLIRNMNMEDADDLYEVLSSNVPQLTLRIAEGDCIVKFQFKEMIINAKGETYDY